MEKRAPTAVIFDLGGVVLNSPFAAIASYERELALPQNAVNAIIQAGGETGAFAKLERGELTTETFAAPFADDVQRAGFAGSGLDGRILITRICDACTPRPLMLDALRLLRSEPKLRTAALTNNFVSENPSAFTDATEGVRPLFDAFIESATERLRKPDPRIYALACQRLEVEPEQCVFIDDIGRNLKPAALMGMSTIKCALEDTRGERALSSLANLLGGDVGRKLQTLLRRRARL